MILGDNQPKENRMNTTLPAPAPHSRVMRVLPTYNPPMMFPDVVWTQEEKFRYVADLIESLPPGHFNLNHWFIIPGDGEWDPDLESYTEITHTAPLVELMHQCGTTACIAGWITADQIHPAFALNFPGDAQDWAGRWLELDHLQAHRLFTDLGFWRSVTQGYIRCLSDVTREEAVQVLRDIADGTREL